jgi:hypothetical protein
MISKAESIKPSRPTNYFHQYAARSANLLLGNKLQKTAELNYDTPTLEIRTWYFKRTHFS